jgi:hypothetical protein
MPFGGTHIAHAPGHKAETSDIGTYERTELSHNLRRSLSPRVSPTPDTRQQTMPPRGTSFNVGDRGCTPA